MYFSGDTKYNAPIQVMAGDKPVIVPFKGGQSQLSLAEIKKQNGLSDVQMDHLVSGLAQQGIRVTKSAVKVEKPKVAEAKPEPAAAEPKSETPDAKPAETETPKRSRRQRKSSTSSQ